MPSIELSETTFRRLQSLAEPLVDTPESVIGRLLEQHGSEVKPAETHAAPGPEADGRRASPGEKTPIEFYEPHLIAVLEEAGGELPASEAVDRVGARVEDELEEIDFEPLKSGEVRWRNTCRWARHRLKEEDVLDDEAPRGIWRLADADGRGRS